MFNLDYRQLYVRITVGGVVLFVKVLQCLDIRRMHLGDVLHCRVRYFVHLDGLSNNNGNGPSVGHIPKVVLEEPSPVNDWKWVGKKPLVPLLELPQLGSRWIVDLVIQEGLTKGEDWHQRPAMLEGKLDKAFSPVQDELDLMRI